MPSVRRSGIDRTMFTGIAQATGRIEAVAPHGDHLRMRIDAGALDLADVREGDSIAVSGCCLTVVDVAPPHLAVDVSQETLRCTSGFDATRRVNLEKALRLSDRLGGHLVTGHIDGVGRVVAHRRAADGEGVDMEVEVPRHLARYVARKGSIALDGVSLTTNAVEAARFTVHLIPHTLAATTLGALAPGAAVNLEVDIVARYVERLRSDAR
jgi:riboflavin synthase